MCGFCAAVAVYGIGKYRLEQQLRNIQALSSGRLARRPGKGACSRPQGASRIGELKSHPREPEA